MSSTGGRRGEGPRAALDLATLGTSLAMRPGLQGFECSKDMRGSVLFGHIARGSVGGDGNSEGLTQARTAIVRPEAS